MKIFAERRILGGTRFSESCYWKLSKIGLNRPRSTPVCRSFASKTEQCHSCIDTHQTISFVIWDQRTQCFTPRHDVKEAQRNHGSAGFSSEIRLRVPDSVFQIQRARFSVPDTQCARFSSTCHRMSKSAVGWPKSKAPKTRHINGFRFPPSTEHKTDADRSELEADRTFADSQGRLLEIPAVNEPTR